MSNGIQRVLMTADAIGGVWTYALELSRGLTCGGTAVGLAVMGGLSEERRAEAVTIPGLTLFSSDYRLEWMPDAWDEVERAGEWLLRIAGQFEPDLVHLNGYAHAPLDWGVPRLVVAHSCVCSWWRAVKGSAAPAEWQRYRSVVSDALSCAHYVVAPSHAMLAALVQEYGAVPHATVIPNGRTARASGAIAKEPFILSAGRLWDEGKNIATLSLAAQGSALPIYVAGDTSAAHDHLHLLGRLPAQELTGWYQRASIYAAPARYEPFGYAPLEAAHAGCALVLGDLPSLREIWGSAAQYVAPDDAAAWRTLLTNLLHNPELARSWGAKARQHAERYSADAMTHHYRELYSHLLRESRPCGSSSSHTHFARTGTTETRTSFVA